MARRSFLALVVAVSAIAGCGTTDAADPLLPLGPTGRVRFVNVITDPVRGRVNAIVGPTNPIVLGVNLTYAGSAPVSLPAPNTALYSSIYTGARQLVLRRTADTSTVVATINFTVAENADYTVYGIGGSGVTPITGFVTRDTNAVVAATSSRVRVVHLSPTAGAVDIFVTARGADLTTATPTLANVPVQGVSGYLTIPAATYQVRVVPAGTAPAARPGAVAINVDSLPLPGGSARTIVAADNSVGGAPLRAFVLTDR
jgi:hypothetical protein